MPNPSTIVIIGPAYPLRGGLASYNERLAREFQAQGFDVLIYTFSLQYPSFLFPGTSQYADGPAPAGLEIRVRINSVNPLNWFRVGREIAKLCPAIIVVRYWLPFMGPCLGTILRQVRRNRQSRILCIADNIIPHEGRPGDTAFTRYFLKPVQGFITMSQKVLADLRTFETKKPARFVPHPLYDNFGEPLPQAEARQKLGLPAADKIILFFGFIRKYKGLDLLLEAMSDSRIREAGIRLLVAGEFYEPSQPYQELEARLGIADHLIWRTHFIPDDEIRYYLCAADLVVQPYRNATQSGVTPLAYHFEKPMVVTRVGALPDMVPDGKAGLVAEPTPDSIATAILRYFELGEAYFLPQLREEKKALAWSRMVEALLDMAHGIPK